MAGHRDSRIRIYATLPSALKAPPHASPGQRPGFWERPITVRPERAQGSPSALSGRKRYLRHVPGASPRAGMLRALGASTSLSSRTEKTATKRYMSWALVAPDFFRTVWNQFMPKAMHPGRLEVCYSPFRHPEFPKPPVFGRSGTDSLEISSHFDAY